MKLPQSLVPNINNVRRGWIQLAVWVFVLALVWLVALPWLSNLPHVRSEIARENARGINPEAMFYSELEVMDEILTRIDARQLPR